MTTLLDTNVIIALTRTDHQFYGWAVQALKDAKTNSPPATICDISFAEASVAYNSAKELHSVLEELGIDRLPTSDEALYLAGQTLKKYRAGGGTRDKILPDFIIGAVASIEGINLVTANPKDFASRFTDVTLVVP